MLRSRTALVIGDLSRNVRNDSDKSLLAKAGTSHRTPYRGCGFAALCLYIKSSSFLWGSDF